ncbi:Glutathione transport system permease protein GsiD [subsurface metagenome]
MVFWTPGSVINKEKLKKGDGMVDSSSGRVAEIKKHSFLVSFLIRLVKEKPLGTVGMVITLLLLLTGIFANFLAPYGMNEVHLTETLAPPSTRYWLGTDNLGRDMLSRVIYGARISVIIGLAATTLSTFLSVVIGILCGYIGGKFDLIVQRFVDAFMCLPWLVLLMVVMSFIGTGMLGLIIVLGLLGGFAGSRIIRGTVISVKENVYVQAAMAIGCSTPRILTRHILPNIMAPIIIVFTTRVPQVILTEASLSFLGFGIPPPAPSWGGMLSGTGRDYMFLAPWMAIWPGLALSMVVYGVNMFGDALRDILDPRLRGGIGRYGVRVKSKPSSRGVDKKQ